MVFHINYSLCDIHLCDLKLLCHRSCKSASLCCLYNRTSSSDICIVRVCHIKCCHRCHCRRLAIPAYCYHLNCRSDLWSRVLKWVILKYNLSSCYIYWLYGKCCAHRACVLVDTICLYRRRTFIDIVDVYKLVVHILCQCLAAICKCNLWSYGISKVVILVIDLAHYSLWYIHNLLCDGEYRTVAASVVALTCYGDLSTVCHICVVAVSNVIILSGLQYPCAISDCDLRLNRLTCVYLSANRINAASADILSCYGKCCSNLSAVVSCALYDHICRILLICNVQVVLVAYCVVRIVHKCPAVYYNCYICKFNGISCKYYRILDSTYLCIIYAVCLYSKCSGHWSLIASSTWDNSAGLVCNRIVVLVCHCVISALWEDIVAIYNSQFRFYCLTAVCLIWYLRYVKLWYIHRSYRELSLDCSCVVACSCHCHNSLCCVRCDIHIVAVAELIVSSLNKSLSIKDYTDCCRNCASCVFSIIGLYLSLWYPLRSYAELLWELSGVISGSLYSNQCIVSNIHIAWNCYLVVNALCKSLSSENYSAYRSDCASRIYCTVNADLCLLYWSCNDPEGCACASCIALAFACGDLNCSRTDIYIVCTCDIKSCEICEYLLNSISYDCYRFYICCYRISCETIWILHKCDLCSCYIYRKDLECLTYLALILVDSLHCSCSRTGLNVISVGYAVINILCKLSSSKIYT